MRYRECGNSGLMLPVLGVGCWAFGGGDYWGAQDQRDVDEVVACALDAGCNYFDTAETYNNGASEESLGKALGARRHEAIIGTKISPSNAYPAKIVEHCEASLKRLGTHYIDIYMVHWPLTSISVSHFTDDVSVINDPPAAADAFETLTRLKEQGKIRHIGVSNFGVERLCEAMQYADIAVNELPYSLLTRAVEIEMLPYCRARGVGVIGYMTLLQGILADIYPTLAEVPAWQRRTRHFDSAGNELCRHGGPGCERETQRAIAGIRSIASDLRLSMAELCIKWAIANKSIACALVGARNRREMQTNLDAVNDRLPDEVVEQLNAATDDVKRALGPSFDYYQSPENDRTA